MQVPPFPPFSPTFLPSSLGLRVCILPSSVVTGQPFLGFHAHPLHSTNTGQQLLSEDGVSPQGSETLRRGDNLSVSFISVARCEVCISHCHLLNCGILTWLFGFSLRLPPFSVYTGELLGLYPTPTILHYIALHRRTVVWDKSPLPWSMVSRLVLPSSRSLTGLSQYYGHRRTQN